MNWKKLRLSGILTAVMASAVLLAGCQKYQPADGSISAAEDVQEAESNPKVESSGLISVITKETMPAFSTVDETVYVKGSQVNLRKEASASAQIIGKLNTGTPLKRIGYSSSWSKVVFQDKECYISSQYVTTTVQETTAAATTAAAAPAGKTGGKLIAIDAGHQAKGNSEKEPIGPGSTTTKAKVASGTAGASAGEPEYKLTLLVSLKLRDELKSRGYETYMIRETHDVNISNAERAEMANKSGADIFVRVHGNSLSDPSVAGTLTMCQTKNNQWNGNLYNKSSALSKSVASGISATTGFKNRGVQETDTMSGINWCKTPVTIVEMGFMSNLEEDKKMATEEYQNKIAKGIADGIDAYYAAGN